MNFFEKAVMCMSNALLKLVKAETSEIPTYQQTSKQKLVKMDERFINWVAQADAADHNYQFDKNNEYVFVRLYDDVAVDITGFTRIESADKLVKTVGKDKGEHYYVFHVPTGRELNRENKTVWV